VRDLPPLDLGTEAGTQAGVGILANEACAVMVRALCRRHGIPVRRTDGETSATSAVVMDVPAFLGSLAEAGGTAGFAEARPGPVVVLLADDAPFVTLAAVARAGAIAVPEADLDLLPLILERLGAIHGAPPFDAAVTWPGPFAGWPELGGDEGEEWRADPEPAERARASTGWIPSEWVLPAEMLIPLLCA
jgi:hypothetical protein